jgi:signal transduction histidine kinase
MYLLAQGTFFLFLHKKFNLVGLLVLATSVSFMVYSVNIIIIGGAYLNTLVFWFPVLPLLVTFIGGRIYGGVATLGVVISVYILYDTLHMNGFVLRNGLSFEQFLTLQNLNIISSSVFVFLLALVLIGTNNVLERNILRVKTKMAENSKSFLISRMSAGLSHEINNPLCAIRFSNEMIKMCLGKEDLDREKLLDMSKRIDSSIDKAIVVVDALRKVGQESAEKSFTYVTILEILSDIERMYNVDMIADDIKFEVVNDTLPSEKIFCSKEKVVEGLIHLINNAVFEAKKSSDENRKISLTIKENGAYYSFSVIDPGHGVDPEISPYMFDPFFTDKDVNVGMGLGLTQVNTIAKGHSGKVTYGLTDGNTTFTLSLGII